MIANLNSTFYIVWIVCWFIIDFRILIIPNYTSRLRRVVVKGACWARWASFWCKDDVITGTGSHVFLRGGNRWPVRKKVDRGLMEPEVTWFAKGNRWPVGKRGSQAHATGSHVIWKGKPLTSRKKGSWAQGEVKPLRKRGLKVQSPMWGTGVVLDSKKQHKKF